MRALAAWQGVVPSEDDLEAVQAFLDAILPELERLEGLLEPDDSPVGLAGSDPEGADTGEARA